MRHVLAALILLLSVNARAADVDIRLGPFGVVGPDGVVIDMNGFQSLAGDLGQVMGPKMLGPAHSTGSLGFNVSLDFSVNNIDEASPHWAKALTDPSSVLSTMHVSVRKGLPYSFQVGGTISHLVGSDLWGLGVDLKYAILDGYRVIPDVSVRAFVNTVLGSRDMSLLLTGGDLTVSKVFGLSGVVSVAPYLGYSAMLVRAASHVLGIFPGDATQPVKFVIAGRNVVRHRGYVGVRVVAFYASMGLEAMLTGGMQSFTATLGVDF
jgi:hypothetical protein